MLSSLHLTRVNQLIVLYDIFISWIIFFLCDTFLSDVFGSDIIVFENWFGDIKKTTRYRFGIGSLEILISVIQMLCFIKLDIIRIKSNGYSSNSKFILSAIHVANGLIWILFYIDWNAWVAFPEGIIDLLPQYIIQKLLYG